MARRSSGSTPRARSGGWKSCGRSWFLGATRPSPSCACGYRRATEASGLSAFRCIRDRVVQMAAVLIIGPIFEADLLPQQYGFRPGLDAKMALRRVYWHVTQHGRREVVDADLRDYFTSIPHAPSDAEPGPAHRRWAYAPRHQALADGTGGGSHRRSAGSDHRSAPDEARNPAGRSDLAAAGQLLLPALPAGLAQPWPSGPTRCARRQLRRRLRHLLPTRQRRGSNDADGEIDDAPWAWR